MRNDEQGYLQPFKNFRTNLTITYIYLGILSYLLLLNSLQQFNIPFYNGKDRCADIMTETKLPTGLLTLDANK